MNIKKEDNYFQGDQLAKDVWINKYALRNKEGEVVEASPRETQERLTKELYRIESKYPKPTTEETILRLLTDFKYLVLGGSSMFGIGNNSYISSLSNCFVIGNNYDSYNGIMRLDEEQVNLMKRRGGVGFDISHLRPFGTTVTNSAKTSTGAVSFMKRFSNTTNEVAQEGRRKTKK